MADEEAHTYKNGKNKVREREDRQTDRPISSAVKLHRMPNTMFRREYMSICVVVVVALRMGFFARLFYKSVRGTAVCQRHSTRSDPFNRTKISAFIVWSFFSCLHTTFVWWCDVRIYWQYLELVTFYGWSFRCCCFFFHFADWRNHRARIPR